MRFYLFIVCLFISCDYLDVVPDNIPTIDHTFRDRIGAERYLATCYSYMQLYGNPNYDPGMLASDEYWLHENNVFYSQFYSDRGVQLKKNHHNITAPYCDYWRGLNGGQAMFKAIRDCNIFLDRIGDVGPELNESEKEQWSAEVKVLKAYYHYILVRSYGPIPLIKENLPVSASPSEVNLYREPFDDCINYIVELIDEATPNLPLKINNPTLELGRITQPIAYSIKAKALVLSASPLFNGNPDFANVRDNKDRMLFNAVFDREKWKRAKDAVQEAITSSLDAGHSFYRFNYPAYEFSDTTKLLMNIRHVVADKWNSELIWASPYSASFNSIEVLALPFFSVSDLNTGGVASNLAPTLNIAEMFYTEHGVPIEEDVTWPYSDRYELKEVTPGHRYFIEASARVPQEHLDRELRFYGNLGFDNGIWHGNGKFGEVNSADPNVRPWVLHMKKGEASGNTSNLKYSITGYYPKKLVHFETTHKPSGGNPTRGGGGRTTFPIIRLSDLYLLLAETANEYEDAPTSVVYDAIDSIRHKSGLKGVVESWRDYSRSPNKPLTKEGMREIIQRERMIELVFEGQRFWDLRRWKLAHEYYNQPVRAWNVEGRGDDFYSPMVLWVYDFQTKDYLWPIAENTLRSATNLVQNPYW